MSVLAGRHPESGAEIPTIGTFVQGHIDRTGDSFRSLQKRSGDVVHHSSWARLAKNTIKEFPEPATVSAIAKALSLSETAVVLSIAKTLGLDVSLSTGLSGIPLPHGVENLTEPQKRVLYETALVMLPPVTKAQARARARRQARSAATRKDESGPAAEPPAGQ